jgi:hypothetical protein
VKRKEEQVGSCFRSNAHIDKRLLEKISVIAIHFSLVKDQGSTKIFGSESFSLNIQKNEITSSFTKNQKMYLVDILAWEA